MNFIFADFLSERNTSEGAALIKYDLFPGYLIKCFLVNSKGTEQFNRFR